MAKNKITIPFVETMDTIYPRRLSSLSRVGSFSLATAVHTFIDERPHVRAAQTNKTAAGSLGSSTVRELHKFLESNDFDSEILVGHKFLKPFVNVCPQLEEMIKENGASYMARILSQGAVRVNSLIIDLLFLKLGDKYTGLNNFPMLEFRKYWDTINEVNHLLDMTPEHVQSLLGKQKVDRVSGVPTKITVQPKQAGTHPQHEAPIITLTPRHRSTPSFGK